MKLFEVLSSATPYQPTYHPREYTPPKKVDSLAHSIPSRTYPKEGSRFTHTFKIGNLTYDTIAKKVKYFDVPDLHMHSLDRDADYWEFHFNTYDGNKKSVDTITNTGNAFKVFATVRKIIQEILNKIGPDSYLIIIARSSEPSRVKLYSKLIGKISKTQWTAKTQKGESHFWLLTGR